MMSTAGGIDATAFVALEAGRDRRACAYDDFVAPIPARAIAPLRQRTLARHRTGDLAAVAAARLTAG